MNDAKGGSIMRPVERRLERAMHETFLVVKTSQADMGSRPVGGGFVSPDLTVGPDGKPWAEVWNLGTREVSGVVTEFAAIAAGMPVTAEHKKLIGYGNVANIGAMSSVTVTCNNIWPHTSPADVLMVTVCHPEMDPVKTQCDPLADRHVGQMNYAWAGTFEGMTAGPSATKVSIQIRPANQGLFRVKAFVAVVGRLPTNPQVDRTMAPTHQVFRWLQAYSYKKEFWELTMLDNTRVAIHCKPTITDNSGRMEPELAGIITRKQV